MLSEAQQGSSDESELFNSLKAYLDNRNRLQPFIGLSSIIECVNGGAHPREAFYICEVCVCRLDMADMRNHIMGSLHRYNYIKIKHPKQASWFPEGSGLTNLARPLMDIAKIIENTEGPGNVQVVEFDKTSYQQMESQSDNAKNVIDFLRDTQRDCEPEIPETITSKIWNQSPSKRIVLYTPWKNLEKAPLDLQNFSQQSNVSNSSSESCADSRSFLDDYAGHLPLIGLLRVIECKSKDDQTYCFLCHCCRVRSLKNDIIDHLTSTSHITNFLMESHPEELESVDLNDVSQVKLLAERLNEKDEKEPDITKIKVVRITESLCVQMTGKSYHWCVKTLGWNNSDFPAKYIDVKIHKQAIFPHLKDCSQETGKEFLKRKKQPKRTKKRKHPVFKVTLPVTQGSLLVKRTSFCEDHIPSFTSSPTETFAPGQFSDSKFVLEPQKDMSGFSSEFLEASSENTNLTSQYQLTPSTDFSQHTYENIKQEMDEQWVTSFQDQSFDCKTNIVTKADVQVDKSDSYKIYTPQAPPLFHSEYVTPQSLLWPVISKENERGALNSYYQQQQPQYRAPDYGPQQCAFSSGYVQGGYPIPGVPQAGNYFSHNNSFSLTDGSQSFTSFYTDQTANTQQYTSYQVSTSGWGSHQNQLVSGQPLCYGPCCAPYPTPAFPNVHEPGPSNALCYPMSNFYSSHHY